VSDNGIQFASTIVVDFFKHLGIQTKFVSVIHPQANGQAESGNKVILSGIKKNLEASKGLWAEQLYEVNAITLLVSLGYFLLYSLIYLRIYTLNYVHIFTSTKNYFDKKQVLWSYHNMPHSTTKETPFSMVYGIDAMLPVKIDTPTWRRDNFSEEGT